MGKAQMIFPPKLNRVELARVLQSVLRKQHLKGG